MLRISTLSAWAQLQAATPHQVYLENVVKPHRSTLAPLWVSALRDYAGIRVDSESLHDNSSVALDSSYSNLGKEVLLPVGHIFLIMTERFDSYPIPVLLKIMACHPASSGDFYGMW
jgi:hypothetical protein